MKRLSFSFSNKMKEQLDKEAKKDCRSLPSLIKIILDEYLENKENK